MGRILLIDDEEELLDALGLTLEDAGHTVLRARDGEEGLATIERDDPDLVISDVNMPRLDGFALCRRLPQAGNIVALILLTSRDTEIDEALGLELGADDYVSKPFSNRILLARVTALLRREEHRHDEITTIEVIRRGRLTLDRERLTVIFDDTVLKTTVTEFKLLETLVGRPGVVFSRDRLLDLIRGDDVVVADRLIDTYVRRLRRKLEAVDPEFDGIETVVGAGYRWRE
jgi:DNA-binding response OmpR family regulator